MAVKTALVCVVDRRAHPVEIVKDGTFFFIHRRVSNTQQPHVVTYGPSGLSISSYSSAKTARTIAKQLEKAVKEEMTLHDAIFAVQLNLEKLHDIAKKRGLVLLRDALDAQAEEQQNQAIREATPKGAEAARAAFAQIEEHWWNTHDP